jgi:hypothetical protein
MFLLMHCDINGSAMLWLEDPRTSDRHLNVGRISVCLTSTLLRLPVPGFVPPAIGLVMCNTSTGVCLLGS